MNDVFGLVGLTMIGAGVTVGYGWDVACIIVGTFLVALAIIGALRK